MSDAVVFKKRERKNFRKKPAAAQEGSDVEEEVKEDDMRCSLQETILRQKDRKRDKGVNAGIATWMNEVAAVEEQSETAKKMSLDTTFQGQTNTVTVDTQMEKYVKEEMRKLKEEAEGGPAQPEVVKAKTLVEELYETPDHLKIRKNDQQEFEQGEDAGRWLTGLMEVNLPIEYKLKNIEETEQAKKKMFDDRASRKRQKHNVSNNFSYNFNQNRRGPGTSVTYQSAPSGPAAGRGSRFASGQGGTERVHMATDDQVFSRFKRHTRK